MNLSMDQICNVGGCVLIFVLLALLVLKPNGLMTLFEGQNNNSPKSNNNNNNNSVNNNNRANNNRSNNNRANNNRANNNSNVGKAKVMASLPLGDNEQFASVSGINTPARSCYPQNSLKPDDLLPKDKKNDVNDFNKNYPVSEGILKGVNFLEAGYQVGVNTVGQSLRNSNQQLRAEPPNPQVNVSPWQNTTIGPDLGRRPLEVGEDCYAAASNNSI
uniref:Minor capsid protein P11 C-terminal conserved region domain-containing protein n=1 Tax=viral metagenome TaxID=1070528 RepID=A0A6C0C7A5_9ZZZZ